ncbi:MAG: chemotaxis protein CheW [Desulfuromonadaceae bacterium]|nr:chemotaxis protein CheW [Desulfuromonadaceae bacterium]
MDLAKIRKKFLQPAKDSDGVSPPVPSPAPEPMKNMPGDIPPIPDSAKVDPFQEELNSSFVAVPEPVVMSSITAILPERIPVTFSPLEAILAGRTAAGCDQDSVLTDEATSLVAGDSSLEFLCFRVSDEIYGINIMDIKEIIKPREVTEVPHAPSFVSGVLSLRGIIIPIIDIRVRLGLAHKVTTGKERIIVIKNNSSFSGLLVDEVTQVVQVQPDTVEAAPAVLDGIDRDFVSGLGHSDGQLIIILNLENISDINLY